MYVHTYVAMKVVKIVILRFEINLEELRRIIFLKNVNK